MLRTRVIPCLLLRDASLVKTVKFDKAAYIGDPLNTCRIFNELEVDEMMILDISASREGREPNFKILSSLVSECFMPLSYGGGITTVGQAERLFLTGFEKIVVNSVLSSRPDLISEIASTFGTQSVIASIDVRKSLFKGYEVVAYSGTRKQKTKLIEWAKRLEQLGAGEILLTSVDREGTWNGYDESLIQQVAEAVSIPVVAHGGAGDVEHIGRAVKAGASAVALGSMVVYQKKGMGVLVNFPDKRELERAIAAR